MIIFWICISILTLLAIAWVAWPLLSKSQSNDGVLGFRSNYLIAMISAVFIALAGLGFYSHWGRSSDVSESLSKAKNAAFVKAAITQYGSRQNIMVALRQQLEHLPMNANQAKGWYILGKLYFNDQQYSAAIDAFTTAVKLKPNESEYVLQLVSSKFLINHRLDTEDSRLIERLVKENPKNINAVNLLALNAYQHGNYDMAVHYWEDLLKYFPPGSEDTKVLLEMIRQGQQHLANNSSVRIQVAVNLADKFQNEIGPNDSLFIYALNAQGPKMPLAVVKTTTAKLPLTVTLDDSQSMIAGRNLSGAQQIYIEVRVSKTGNAMPAKGDLFGKSAIIEDVHKENSIAISINQKIN